MTDIPLSLQTKFLLHVIELTYNLAFSIFVIFLFSVCHKSCGTCSAVNASDKCLTCHKGQSLQGPPPSSCAGRRNSTGQEQGQDERNYDLYLIFF